MHSKQFSISALLFLLAITCNAQESVDGGVADRLLKAEETIKNFQSHPEAKTIESLRKVEKELKSILGSEPHTIFRAQVESDLDVVYENLGIHNLSIAAFYMANTHSHSLRGAEARLIQIVQNYPKFSRMDETLFRLGVVMVKREKPDDASRIFQQLICRYPNSEYVNAAFAQLYQIGISSWPACEQFEPYGFLKGRLVPDISKDASSTEETISAG